MDPERPPPAGVLGSSEASERNEARVLLPEGARRMLNRLGSLDALEVLVALAEGPEVPVDEHPHPALARSAFQRDRIVEALVDEGFVVPLGDGRYQVTDDPELRAIVGTIVRAYRENPAPIVRMLTGEAIGRVRRAAVRALSEPPRKRHPKR